MDTQPTILPLDIRRDLDGLGELMTIAFADNIAATGNDFLAEVRILKKLVPLIIFLRRVSKTFRHRLDGFVIKDQDKIISAIIIKQLGAENKNWEIGNVATHPDYRQRGLARKLVMHAIEHARTHGAETCLLEVRSENTPAFQLYSNAGFAHYDSTTILRLENTQDVQSLQAVDVTIRPINRSEWKLHYELACLETPQEVQAFLPVSAAKFQVSALEKLIERLLGLFRKTDEYNWAFEKGGKLIGIVHLAAKRTQTKGVHSITVRVLPTYRSILVEPMLTLALQTSQSYPRKNTLTQIRTSLTDQIDIFKKYGFVEIEVTHRLGLKLEEPRCKW